MVPRAANTKAAKLKASSSGACNNAGNNTAERQRQRQPQWRFKRQQQNVLAALGKDTRTHVNKYVYVCAALTHVHKRSAAAGNSYNACVVDAYTLSLVIVCALNCQHNKSAHSNSLHKCQFSNTLISFRQLNVSDEPSNCHCSAQQRAHRSHTYREHIPLLLVDCVWRSQFINYLSSIPVLTPAHLHAISCCYHMRH